MNAKQLGLQLQYELQNHVWPGSATKVFAGNAVLYTMGIDKDLAKRVRHPAALIRVYTGTPDPKHRQNMGLLSRQFAVTLVASVAGDKWGEGVLIGRNRASLTTSDGAGLLDLESELHRAVGRLNALEGVNLSFVGVTTPRPEYLDGTEIALRGDYVFDGLITTLEGFHMPTGFLAVDATGGNASLTWTLPPARYDRIKVILRRAAGSTPPAAVTDGTGITLSGDLATSDTDDPGAGTFSYSLFGAYDYLGDGTEDSYSDPATQTVVVT